MPTQKKFHILRCFDKKSKGKKRKEKKQRNLLSTENLIVFVENSYELRTVCYTAYHSNLSVSIARTTFMYKLNVMQLTHSRTAQSEEDKMHV